MSKIAKSLIVIMFIFSFSSLVLGSGIGVSPAELEFGKVMKDVETERTFTIQNAYEEDSLFEITVDEEAKEWFSFEPSSPVRVPENGQEEVTIQLKPPKTIQNGEYDPEIHIHKVSDVEEKEDSAVVGITTGVALTAKMEVTGEQKIEGELVSLSASDTEIGTPLRVVSQVENTGNVNLKPEVNIEIFKIGRAHV